MPSIIRFLVIVGAAATTFSLADFLSYLGVHLPPIGAVLAIVFVFVLAESVTRARLADIYELAGRLLVSTALAFCLAAIFYLFVMVIGGFDTMYLNAVLAAIVFLVLFEPLQTEVETRIHQFMFRERYMLETGGDELRKRLAHVLEIDEMVSTVMQSLERSHRVTTAALYLRDQDGDGFDLAGSFGAAVPKRIEALGARPLLDRLERHPSLALEDSARETGSADAAVRTAASGLGALQSAVALSVRGEEEKGAEGFSGHSGVIIFDFNASQALPPGKTACPGRARGPEQYLDAWLAPWRSSFFRVPIGSPILKNNGSAKRNPRGRRDGRQASPSRNPVLRQHSRSGSNADRLSRNR